MRTSSGHGNGDWVRWRRDGTGSDRKRCQCQLLEPNPVLALGSVSGKIEAKEEKTKMLLRRWKDLKKTPWKELEILEWDIPGIYDVAFVPSEWGDKRSFD